MTRSINENRLFSLLPFFFDNPAAILVEIAQNAQRSGATRLDITLEDGVLKTIDNGSGTDNPEPLFVLADSNWSEEVEENQKPAGWGLFFLYSIAETVTFASLFGLVEVDCKKYLSDGEYRKDILKRVNPNFPFSGFSIKAVLRKEIKNNLLECVVERLGWFPLDITVNGKSIIKQMIQSFGSFDICTVYEGNRVYINAWRFPESSEQLRARLMTIWYGIPVNLNGYTRSAPSVVIDVKVGSPLTPVLPYRHAVKEDEKFDAFWKFLRAEVVRFSTECINGALAGEDHHLVDMMINMEHHATQAQLDELERFYFNERQPYHRSCCFDEGEKKVVITKFGDSPVNQVLVLEGLEDFFEKKSFDCNKEDIFLPEDTIKSVKLQDRHPNWLKVKTVTHTVRVTVKPESSFGRERFNWVKCSIETDCSEAIKVLAVVSDSQYGFIFYVDNPADFKEICEPVFDKRVFYEEGDEWDSQFFNFEQEIENDIASITGKFELYKLLDGLLVAGIAPNSVVSIKVNGNIMTVKTTQEVKQLQLS